MTFFKFTSGLYQDRDQMIRFLNLVSLENMGRDLDALPRMELVADHQEMEASEKPRLKQALRSMYRHHVQT